MAIYWNLIKRHTKLIRIDIHFQFIDLCILLGCDYCESIRGIGPKRAIELVSQYKCIEEILKNIDQSKYIVPEDWNYEQARELFKNPEVAEPDSVEVCNF